MAITLDQIAYNIRNLAYGGKSSEDNNISLRQIKHWVHYHRAKLIADNIDKGILTYSNLYQQMELTVRNSISEELADFHRQWYLISKSGLPAPVMGSLVALHPPSNTNSNQLSGSFLAYNNDFPVRALNTTSQVKNWDYDKYNNKDQYGRDNTQTQTYERGDWRNVGSHGFIMPTPLMLKDDNGIKEVNLYRKVHVPGKTPETIINRHHNGISLYNKTNSESAYGNYNKFTNNTNQYYELDKYISMTDTHPLFYKDFIKSSHTFSLYGANSQQDFENEKNIGYSVIKFKGLQISPNYHGRYETPQREELYWAYNATAKMILEDPTQVSIMYHQDNMGNAAAWSPGFIDERPVKHQWDDSASLYPIPAEYISDLIQRVVQSETKTGLSTMSDERTDGMDTSKLMKRGE
jgi:hypothetical protein